MPLIMYRIVITKVSSNVFKHKCFKGSPSLRNCIRYYTSKPICPPGGPQKPKPKTGNKILTIGAISLIGGGTLAYARTDPDFRQWLNDNVPYSDEFIKLIFQEEKSYVDSFRALLDAIKASVLNIFFGEKHSKKARDIETTTKGYIPPSPAFETLAKEAKESDSYTEIRLEQRGKENDEPTVTISGDLKQKEEKELDDVDPRSIADLEATIGQSAAAAIESYNTAVFAMKNYNQDVQIIIEDSVERLDPEIWNSLRQKTKTREEALQNAEKNANETKENIKKLEDVLKQPDFDAPDVVKQRAKMNMNKIKDDIEQARRELETVKLESSITDKYWKRVEEARAHFIDEIEILFPGVNIGERKLELQGSELDLFILHAFSNVLYYQKELYKLQILEEQRLKTALDNARRGSKEILTDAQINQQVEKEKRNIAAEFQKKCLCLRMDSERELRRQLKLQSETFSDHLSDALKVREIEMERDFARHLDEKLTEERCRFKMQLSALAGRVKGMDHALKEKAQTDKIVKQSQVLWSACQALFRSLRAGCPGLPWTEQIRPLYPEILAVKKAAADNDELVHVVIAGIPELAKERGVYPEDALRERFLKVEKVCRHLALIPEGGARLPLHVLSYLQSMLLLKAASPIPQAELNDEEVDFANLTTNDVLQRARYWLDRGDFAQTLRYMNLLEGAPRCAAKQWIEEARILLETQQAANTLMAHAAASGLMYL